ncbi:MAG: DoxX family membrane protein [bacterium]|nr:DoxX family membrane protein [bacterium]
MLNPFPDLLTFAFFAPLILRLALGILFFNFGHHTLTKGKLQHGALFEALGLKQGTRYATALGIVEIILGILLIIGLYTQIAALVGLILSLAAYYLKGKHDAHVEHRRHLFFLTAAISLSLLLSGAGAIAFDLPL